jgi:hypothetical protein
MIPMSDRKPARRTLVVGLCGLIMATASATSANAADGKIFVVGNYPVEARAADAVAAKDQAIADGQQAAFRSLLKRIVPVTSYARLKNIKRTPAGPMIEGFSVRSERNSSTQYIASYDFSFQPEAVQRLLDQQGIPYLDKQAPRIVVIPMYRAGGQQPNVVAEASDAWMYAWRGLDLTNSLTPVSLVEAKRQTHPDTIKAVLAGDQSAQRTLGTEYQTTLVVLAALEPSADGKKATVTLAGQDAVGPIHLVRSYKLDGDLAYTAELAAVVGLGVLEGRWKAANAHLMAASAPAGFPPSQGDGFGAPSSSAYGTPPASSYGTPPASSYGTGPSSYPAAPNAATGGQVRLSISFQGMGEWQQISQRLSATPGVSNMEVEGLSARGARMSLVYPGGAEALARALSSQGLSVRSGPDGLQLSAR